MCLATSRAKGSTGGQVVPVPANAVEDPGELQPIAARVLMKILYGARMARYDFLRAVNSLACNVARWTVACDRQLRRLMRYVHHSLDLRMVGWVGDPPTPRFLVALVCRC